MATYRKKLLDKDGNTIIPALAGDETGWVKTGDLANSSVTAEKIANGAVTAAKIDDGAVTLDKIAQNVVNNAIVTGGNLAPSTDTPEAWRTLYGNTDGRWVTPYTISGTFAQQPSQYGTLETTCAYGAVYQVWHTHPSGLRYCREGQTTYWTDSGKFRLIHDSKASCVYAGTTIAANSDLNTLPFIQPGEYSCNYASTVQSLANCPATTAFKMKAESLLNSSLTFDSTSTWSYVFRTIIDIDGKVWIQKISSNGDNPVVWSYGGWKRVQTD